MHFQEFDACRNLEDFGKATAGHGTPSFMEAELSIFSEASFMTAVCCACDILISMPGASEAGGVALEPAACRVSSTGLDALRRTTRRSIH